MKSYGIYFSLSGFFYSASFCWKSSMLLCVTCLILYQLLSTVMGSQLFPTASVSQSGCLISLTFLHKFLNGRGFSAYHWNSAYSIRPGTQTALNNLLNEYVHVLVFIFNSFLIFDNHFYFFKFQIYLSIQINKRII